MELWPMILFEAVAAVDLIAEPIEDEVPACCCRAIAACADFDEASFDLDGEGAALF